ncbi:MAG: glycosyltransferase [Gammaproteobacteria bacterium]|nr:glycosyltransferase [Gammaproteobacteria bacterium]
MKILHVITNYAGAGGAEKMLSRLVESTPQCEHAIIALMGFSELYSHTLEQTIQHEELNWNLINTLSVVWKLKKLIDEIKPDVIQGWMYHGNVFASVASRLSVSEPPVVWGMRHSLDAPKEESVSTKVALHVSKWLSGHPAIVVYCAQSALKKHIQFGFVSRKDVVIPNGVLLNHSLGVRSFDRSQVVVGFAGRYHTAKGFQYLFEAISQVQQQNRDVCFRLAGNGVELDNPAIAALMSQHHIDPTRIELLGQVSDMPTFYHSIDLLMLTSITEGFPNVLVEAMAAGVPCVTTDVGDARPIVDQTGFVVPARDAGAISREILSYIGLTPAQKEDLSSLALERIKSHYQLHAVANMYIDIWEQAGRCV